MKAAELDTWDETLADARSLVMSSLTHEGSLTIILQAKYEEDSALLCFSFNQPHSYSYRRDSYANERSNQERKCASIVSPNSLPQCIGKFFRRLRKMIETSKTPGPNAFLFVCDDLKIEVVSCAQPTVRILGRKPLR